MQDDAEIRAIFEAEVEQLLGDLAAALEDEPATWELDALLIITHTFKGTSRMVEAEALVTVAHLLEECLVELRDGGGRAPEFVELAREGCAQLERIADDLGAEHGRAIAAYRERVARFIDPARLEVEGEAELPLADPVAHPQPGLLPTSSKQPGDATVRVGTKKIDLLLGLASDFLAVGHSLHAQRRASSRAFMAWSGAVRRRPELAAVPEVQELVQALAELESDLANTARHHAQVSQEFHDGVRQLRMIRVSTLSGIFARTVRGAARAAGKRARFVIEGGTTEIDRVTLDTLRDPLIHMIRNAVAHGIETPERRELAGKPSAGTTTPAARASGSSLVLEVHDDGAGLDVQALRRRAVERGELSAAEGEEASDSDLSALIFSSGLSTAESVGELSGRGVGMSVVQDNIGRLGGKVTVSSERGQGCTISLEVPLTRLTTYCVHTRLGAHEFLVPLSGVRSTALVPSAEFIRVDGREVIEVNGQPLPLLRLERAFDFSADESERRPILVVRDDRKISAIMVDEVLGQTEVIIQSLSRKLDQVRGVSGAGVLDGEQVIPVLDIHELLTLDPSSLPAGSVRAEVARSAERRILVVDDSITSRTLLRNILSAAGYTVEVCVDAPAALTRLQAERFDLVVSDVEMPGMDGFEFTGKIRASPATRDLPVIICTSLGNQAEKSRGAAAGANAYVVKGSFEQDELLAAIDRLC